VRVLAWGLALILLSGCQGQDAPESIGEADNPPSADESAAEAIAEGMPEEADAAFAPRKPVIEETIAYGEATDRNLIGVLTLPADSFEPPPGVLLIHEWWGLNDTARTLARRLAGEGFVVLALDLYGGEVADSTIEAQGLMTRVMTDPQAALENIRQGIEYLRLYALAPRVGVAGWSFGGTWALQAGMTHAEQVDAVVTYYGQIVTNEAEIERLDSPLLGVFAGQDASITADAVVGFRSLLRRVDKNADLRIYPDSLHEFATPGSPNYESASAEDAWALTVEFLNRNLR
jgi:carboxymethylenebutenolidase